MSVLQKLTEGIVHRDVTKEGVAVLSKWEQTGLLEGLGDERTKNTMAVLLENQAKELLRESSSMAGGDVEGFASVAFPIVRRVFGGLIANDLVSVQPMSLPSGLIFFLDFQRSTSLNGSDANANDPSVYGGLDASGGAALGAEIKDGVSLAGDPGGFYNLTGTHSSPKAIYRIAMAETFDDTVANLGDTERSIVRHDPDIMSSAARVVILTSIGQASALLAEANGAAPAVNEPAPRGGSAANLDLLRDATIAIGATINGGDDLDSAGATPNPASAGVLGAGFVLARRLTHVNAAGQLVMVATATDNATAAGSFLVTLPIKDDFNAAGSPSGLGAVVGGAQWGLEGTNSIPEIDIKVDSIAVTAVTKKLKAKWTPELAQDLNAYHSLDAEVELTGILSEQIALEIDQEILGDLVDGAKGSTLYWSRRPGKFLNRSTGASITSNVAPPDFTGTVSEWYETLVETINDVSAQIHRKVLRGGANFIVVSPEVANVLEFTSGFRASVIADQDRGSVGAVKAGSISKKWDVFVDPYFPRNVILVGRKGSSFLESGYVYAPYVPLQTTPTIFGPEDFVPRKGVMTRYAKQMVRPDMYGLVIVQDLVG
jgi:hypothetical protein